MLRNLRVPIMTFKAHSKTLHRIMSNHDCPIDHFEVSNSKSYPIMTISTIDLANGVSLVEPDNFGSINSQVYPPSYGILQHIGTSPFP